MSIGPRPCREPRRSPSCRQRESWEGRMIRTMLTGVALTLALGTSAMAQAPDPTVANADYANPALWLCRPDLKDNKCKVDLDATVIAADGKTHGEKFVAAKDPTSD